MRKVARDRKDSFCEKPVAFDLAVIDRALAAEESGSQAPGGVQQAVRCELRQGRGNRMIELEYQGSRPRLQSLKVFGIGVSRRSPVPGMNHRCSVCAIEYGDDDSHI